MIQIFSIFVIHFWMTLHMWSLKKECITTTKCIPTTSLLWANRGLRMGGATRPVCRWVEIHAHVSLAPEVSMQNNPCSVLPCRQHLVGITLCTHRGEESPCLLYSWGTDAHERKNINPCHSDIKQLYRDLKLKPWFWIQRELKGILSVIPHAPPSLRMSIATWSNQSVTSFHALKSLVVFTCSSYRRGLSPWAF